LNVFEAYEKQAQEQELCKKITDYISSGKDLKNFKFEYYLEKFNAFRYKKTEFYNLKKVEYLNCVEFRMYKLPIMSGVKQTTSKTEYKEIDGIQYNKQTGEQRTEESIKRSLNTSLKRTKQKIYDYALANNWEDGFFFTLTFNPDYVDSFNYDECLKRVCQFLKNVKSQNPNFKYIFVPEYHKSGRIHFHGLGTNCENLILIDSGKVKNGKKIYNINSRSYKYGFSTVSKIEDTNKVSSYITKYITKELITNTKGKHRYLFSKNLDIPTITTELIDSEDKELTKTLMEGSKKFQYKKVSGGGDFPNTITYYHLKK